MKKNMTPQILDMQTKTQLKKWYDEFHIFMQIPNKLPDFNVNIFDSTNLKQKISVFFSMTLPRTKVDKPMFNIERHALLVEQENMKSTVFHEFTHIYDNKMLIQDFDDDKRPMLLSLYTEYHAVQNQMKAAMGFNLFSDNNYFNENTPVLIGVKRDTKTVRAYLDFMTKDYINTLNNFYAGSKNNTKMDILRFGIYYISICDFFERYCSDSIAAYIDKAYFDNRFGNQFKSLCDEIRTTNLSLNSFVRQIQYANEISGVIDAQMN